MNSNEKSRTKHVAQPINESEPVGTEGRISETDSTRDDAGRRAKANTDTVGLVQSPSPTDADPFDPDQLRLSQDFAASVGVKKVLMTMQVRKPSKEWFVRTHPDPDYRLETMLLELKEDREIYLVDRELWPVLAAESTVGPRALFLAVNRQGDPFFWPIRLPGPDGKLDSWNRSALEAATRAATAWVRVQPNMSAGMYDLYECTADIPEPKWPEPPMPDLLRLAFKDLHITNADHPVLLRLRGEL